MSKNTKPTLEVDDTPFVRSHGRKPTGRGSWAFSLQFDPRDILNDVVFSPSLTFTEAKAWVKKWFREQQQAGKFPLLHGASHVTLFVQS